MILVLDAADERCVIHVLELRAKLGVEQVGKAPLGPRGTRERPRIDEPGQET